MMNKVEKAKFAVRRRLARPAKTLVFPDCDLTSDSLQDFQSSTKLLCSRSLNSFLNCITVALSDG